MAKKTTDENPTYERGRGRDASRPSEIPLRGWKDIALRVKSQMEEDRITLIAGSVAFYTMLAIVPTLIALVTLYGLVADASDVQTQITSLSGLLPREGRVIVADQLSAIASQGSARLGLGLLISMVGALWAASGGMFALIRAVNIAYGEHENRSFLQLRALAIALTIGALFFAALVVFAIGILPAIFAFVGLGDEVRMLLDLGRWPILALLATAGLSAIYRYAPCRTKAKWRWVTWGGAIATALWLAMTGLFSIYVSNFGSYNETYGALGGVVVLMLWLYLTALAILLGAEVDAEMEHQTAHDSTVGEPAPMGERGAEMADTLGESHV
ncbi:MAG: YihY/virulence factor BrkB family protein [Myxococcota bacterium]|nr:YihY/virulence factor BrkB family protein [Myxococcota bacterium]